MNEFELIEDYLKGKLQGQTLIEFENKLASNSNFASKVEEHKAMQEMLITQGLLETRDKLQALRKQKISNERRNNNGNNEWFKGIGYSIIILGVVMGIYMFYPKDKNAVEVRSVVAKNNNENSTIGNVLNPTQDIITITSPEVNSHDIDSSSSNLNPIIQKTDSLVNTSLTYVPIDTQAVKPPENKSSDHQNTPPAIAPNDLCEAVTIRAKIQTEPSCEDKSTGSLTLSQVVGGKGPYKYTLNNLETSRSLTFDRLPGGNHEVKITDINGCYSILETEIAYKSCTRNIFSPDYGETWKFPISSQGNCKVTIYDSAGKIVYQVNTYNGQPSEWDGTGNNEGYIKAGAYLFQITCDDGKSNQGSVTVTR